MRVSVPPSALAVLPNADAHSAFSWKPVVWPAAILAMSMAFFGVAEIKLGIQFGFEPRLDDVRAAVRSALAASP